MNANNCLVNKGKNEVKEQLTYQCKVFSPDVDILEDKENIVVIADLPGVKKENVSLSVEKGVLAIDAKIDPKEYEGMKVIYSEYNIGNYYRQFKLGSDIDGEKISASMDSGVLKILLPKSEGMKHKMISIA